MNRREFLLAGAAVWMSGPALAQMKMRGPGMSGMSGMPVLPEGAPLRELPRLANMATEGGRFEAALTAGVAKARFADGLDTPILAYNGESPGPIIQVTEGDRVRIAFRNAIPNQASTIHWHGMPVPADQDGNPMDAVASGDSRTYEFTLPEGSAASYWYHPHPHGLTAEQVYRGLAGAFLVKPKVDPIPAAYGDTVLFLTDLRLAADGSLPEQSMADLMNGRVGDQVLVNGQKKPVLTVQSGTRRRFRLFNATNARFLRLTFGDAPMTIIGSDGGLLAAPVQGATEILLSPAERAEVVVAFEKAGSFALKTLPYDRGWMGPGRPDDGDLTLMSVEAQGVALTEMPPLPEALRQIPELAESTVRRRFVFGESMGGLGGMTMVFMINGKTFDRTRVDVEMRAGQIELWEIQNPTDMDHPFHIHGTQFQVVEVERKNRISKPAYRAWKDTINVGRGETVRIAVRQELPGLRMFHCHILEHEDQGMMGIVDVVA
ncbi:MAG TPA: multicopper oxidase family protein [Steroidobacteraceae bacterium]|nr:multicopper oxidase family protein [Steroidobacteraceae bacterium]